MTQLPDKRRVLDALVAQLSGVLASAVQAAEATREGATHAEAKPENDKDTRALEQTYLARGQAMRVEELAEQVQVLRFMPLRPLGSDDPISAGALVLLEAEDGERCVFMAPHGGGVELQVEGLAVQVVTPTSPLGHALLGRVQGDELSLRLQRVAREYVIAKVF